MFSAKGEALDLNWISWRYAIFFSDRLFHWYATMCAFQKVAEQLFAEMIWKAYT